MPPKKKQEASQKGSTPKFQKLKQQQQKLKLNEDRDRDQQKDKNADENKNLTQFEKEKKQDNLNVVQNQQKSQLHTKSQLKKLISINSENFVLCKSTNFENDYEIISKIGQGSFGSVYKIRHRVLKLDRALKKIKKNPTSQFSNFEQIQILKKLDHRNILKIFQFYETEDYYMIVTEIFEGRQLFDEIIDSEKINEEIAIAVMREILITLKYTHALGIAHRDIKPENILVKGLGDKDKFKIKVIDWGLGTLISEHFSQRVCGTPEYAAPEVYQGKYTVLCDMWSLGVLAFVMLTGNMPFKGTNTQDTISQVKRSIINYRGTGFRQLSQLSKQFITSLIQKDSKKRLTAQQALSHPWLCSARVEQSVQAPESLKQTLDRLKSLNLVNQFGVAVVNLINNHFSSIEEKEKLQDIFKFLDTNNDGSISKQELIQGYIKVYGKQTALEIAEQTFKKLDVNNSGTLEFSEFIAYGLRTSREQEKEKFKQVFDMFDSDKNGSISYKEISKILQGRLQGLYEEDMKQILIDVNQNKDEEINFQEFYKFMQSMLYKVDVIRSSKKMQSMIKSQGPKIMNQQKPQQKVALKRTDSIDEAVQNQKNIQPQVQVSSLKQKDNDNEDKQLEQKQKIKQKEKAKKKEKKEGKVEAKQKLKRGKKI